jgi:hypothetical protein
VVVTQVHDAVTECGSVAKTRGVIERSSEHFGSGSHDGGGRGVGTGQSHDLVAGTEKFRNYRGADPARRASEKYTHNQFSFDWLTFAHECVD